MSTDNVFGYYYDPSDHYGPISIYNPPSQNTETTEYWVYTPVGYTPYANSIKLVYVYDSVPDATRWNCQSAP